MMRGWEQSHMEGVEQYTHVYDKDYRDAVSLVLNSDGTLTLEGLGEAVKLDAKGVENLRKKLQQTERYLKDNPPSTAFTELLDSPELAKMLDGYDGGVQTEADGLNEGEELQ